MLEDSEKMTSNQPYLIRALHQWITDNGLTPYIMVDATLDNVFVPKDYIEKGKITLNVDAKAVENLIISNDNLECQARFTGVSEFISVPMNAILAIFAKENGQCMLFNMEKSSTNNNKTISEGNQNDFSNIAQQEYKKPHLTIVK